MPKVQFSSVVEAFKKESVDDIVPVPITRQNAMMENLMEKFEEVRERREDIKEEIQEKIKEKIESLPEEVLEKIEEVKAAIPQVMVREPFLPNVEDLANVATVFSIGLAFGVVVAYCFSKEYVYVE